MPLSCLARPFLIAILAVLPATASRAVQKSDPADAVPEQECDRLAQPPKRTMSGQGVSEGVDSAGLRWPAARAACAKAMQEFPGEVRFVAYAARAATKGGDLREAARLYRAAADEGNALAQNNLGSMYENGEVVQRDLREAVKLYRASADQGFAAAQNNLGAMYSAGRGVQRDDREAVRLWQLSADQGDDGGLNNLATMYAQGRGGVQRDMTQAIRMWRQAAELGSTEARNNLRKVGQR